MAPKRLLAVWAHPDDESFGPVGTLCLARDHGWQTAIVCATRGDAGQSVEHIQARGQTLGDLREAELRCACDQIGVDRLHVWRFPDGELHDVPPATLQQAILGVMREWQPQVVITFGPDGITGHPDHIAIGAAATVAFHQLQQRHNHAESLRLYYVTMPPERRIRARMGDAPPPGSITALIDVAAYAEVKLAALHCHASQRSGWQPLIEDRDWLTVDRFHRAFPPVQPGEPVASTIFDA